MAAARRGVVMAYRSAGASAAAYRGKWRRNIAAGESWRKARRNIGWRLKYMKAAKISISNDEMASQLKANQSGGNGVAQKKMQSKLNRK